MARGARFRVFSPSEGGSQDWIVLEFDGESFNRLCEEIEVYKKIDEYDKQNGTYNSTHLKCFHFEVKASHPAYFDKDGKVIGRPLSLLTNDIKEE